MSKLGELVKKSRTEKKLTQVQLAAVAGCGLALVQRLENDHARYVMARDISNLARGLDMPESALWETIRPLYREHHYIRLD